MNNPSNPTDPLQPSVNDELADWFDSFRDVVDRYGATESAQLLDALRAHAESLGVPTAPPLLTPYANTIPPGQQQEYPGDSEIEARLRHLIRWNAMAMVVRANKHNPGIGGHIATYASAATLFEVGFHHFFHARNDNHPGDFVYLQGHASPGVYARAFLEGPISEQQLERFRRETPRETGLPSYPHPWLMPDFWQFPTVSMGLAPLMAVYQARFLRYLQARGIVDTSKSHVWALLGDGEMDEPESTGGLLLAAREKLDNLTFVINCNLQRLDGPVRGNGKVIQDLEGIFRGAGWNVVKVIWGSEWDELLAADKSGQLIQRMNETIDGEYQMYAHEPGSYMREHFFGKSPVLQKLVEHLSDDQIKQLSRGGHDPRKVFAAYDAAVKFRGAPTVVLANTIKGYGMGTAGEAYNTTHAKKSMTAEQLLAFRTRFNVPISDEEVADSPFYKPVETSREIKYLHNQRRALGGYLPARAKQSPTLSIPSLESFAQLLEGSGDRPAATTMTYGRMLERLMENDAIGDRIVPIVPDEARTFGLEGVFSRHGLYSPKGQLYTSVDAGTLTQYTQSVDGQFLDEGITEAGSIASFIAAGTAYCNLQTPMIPFYAFYSMFGFQRIGDFLWAAADAQAKGFLLGCTAGRTTLMGEGLQHCDGHSPLVASTIPTLQIYDPAFAYEVVVIIQEGMRRMYEQNENVFYYLTLYNESYAMPPMPEGASDGILRGMYEVRRNDANGDHPSARPQLFGSGTILNEALRAQQLLAEHFHIPSDVWSITSYNLLRRDAMANDREDRLQPSEIPKRNFLQQELAGRPGPFIAATDYMAMVPDQIAPWIPGRYVTLGTDGFGRSDTREALREHFEISANHIAYAALTAMAADETFAPSRLPDARKMLGIDANKLAPVGI